MKALADTGFADKQQRTRIVEPTQGVDLFDFRLRDRAFRGEVKVFERRTRELSGF